MNDRQKKKPIVMQHKNKCKTFPFLGLFTKKTDLVLFSVYSFIVNVQLLGIKRKTLTFKVVKYPVALR